MRIRCVSAVLLAMICAAGRASPARELTRQAFDRDDNDAPLDHLVFRGSDSTNHYLTHARFKTSEDVKVRRDALELPASLREGDVSFRWRADASTQPATRKTDA